MLRLVCCTDPRGQARMRLYAAILYGYPRPCNTPGVSAGADARIHQSSSAGNGEAQCTGWSRQRQAQSVRAFSGLVARGGRRGACDGVGGRTEVREAGTTREYLSRHPSGHRYEESESNRAKEAELSEEASEIEEKSRIWRDACRLFCTRIVHCKRHGKHGLKDSGLTVADTGSTAALQCVLPRTPRPAQAHRMGTGRDSLPCEPGHGGGLVLHRLCRQGAPASPMSREE